MEQREAKSNQPTLVQNEAKIDRAKSRHEREWQWERATTGTPPSDDRAVSSRPGLGHKEVGRASRVRGREPAAGERERPCGGRLGSVSVHVPQELDVLTSHGPPHMGGGRRAVGGGLEGCGRCAGGL